MSQLQNRVALYERLFAMPGGIEKALTSLPNAAAERKALDTEAWQQVNVLFADTQNPSFSTPDESFARETGYMQVALMFPQNVGEGAALSHAEALRAWFKRGLTVTANNVSATILRKASIRPGRQEADRYVVRVMIPFFSNTGA